MHRSFSEISSALLNQYHRSLNISCRWPCHLFLSVPFQYLQLIFLVTCKDLQIDGGSNKKQASILFPFLVKMCLNFHHYLCCRFLCWTQAFYHTHIFLFSTNFLVSFKFLVLVKVNLIRGALLQKHYFWGMMRCKLLMKAFPRSRRSWGLSECEFSGV